MTPARHGRPVPAARAVVRAVRGLVATVGMRLLQTLSGRAAAALDFVVCVTLGRSLTGARPAAAPARSGAACLAIRALAEIVALCADAASMPRGRLPWPLCAETGSRGASFTKPLAWRASSHPVRQLAICSSYPWERAEPLPVLPERQERLSVQLLPSLALVCEHGAVPFVLARPQLSTPPGALRSRAGSGRRVRMRQTRIAESGSSRARFNNEPGAERESRCVTPSWRRRGLHTSSRP